MSLAMDVRCATIAWTVYDLHNTQDMLPQLQLSLTMQITRVFLNYNFSKEQCMLPEDDRMIEKCRSVLSVLMWISDH